MQQFLFDPDWQRRFPFLVAHRPDNVEKVTTLPERTSAKLAREHADRAASAADDRHEGQVQS